MNEASPQAAQELIYLLGCAVREEIPDLSGIDDTQAIYACAAQHMLTAAAAMALESAGRKDAASTRALALAVRKASLFQKAYAEVGKHLTEKGIWYLPLKGLVLKEYYPKFGMREMSDHDILFDSSRTEDVRSVMEELGFTAEYFGEGRKDDVYRHPSGCVFEMHRELFGPGGDNRLHDYYQNIRDRLLGEGCEKHLCPEDFYLYITAHEYKHYSGGGTGLRSLLDTYVYLRREEPDMDYVAREAEKLGLAEFEAANRTLARRLFSGEPLTEAEGEMLTYFLSSGTFGTKEHWVQNRMNRTGSGRLQFSLERFFSPINKNSPDYERLVEEFPFFYRHRVLLPGLMVYRVFRSVKSGKFQSEMEAIKNAKPKRPGR